MRGSRNFRQGGGGVQVSPTKKSSDNVFFFSNCLFPIETHITCDFPGGSGPPVPPSGSALVLFAMFVRTFSNKTA